MTQTINYRPDYLRIQKYRFGSQNLMKSIASVNFGSQIISDEVNIMSPNLHSKHPLKSID